MNSDFSKKWLKVILWAASYVHFIGYILVGGYFIIKNDDEELKKESKLALIISLIFLGIECVFAIITYFVTLSESLGAIETLTHITNFISIAKIITFAVFVIKALLEKEKNEINN